jgi:hypothetical protein
MKTRDARVLILSTILSDGKSSRLYKKIVDDKRWPCKLVISNNQEDYGMYILYGLPQPKPLKIYLLKLMQKTTDRTNF